MDLSELLTTTKIINETKLIRTAKTSNNYKSIKNMITSGKEQLIYPVFEDN